jgi:hypothetical protein
VDDLNNIHWHNCKLVSLIEVPDNNLLAVNVQYPENIQDDIFSAKGIIFNGFYALEIHEEPTSKGITLLSSEAIEEHNGYTTVKIETSAGYRLIKAQGVSLGPAVVRI